jgi:hypothetical protein
VGGLRVLPCENRSNIKSNHPLHRASYPSNPVEMLPCIKFEVIP